MPAYTVIKYIYIYCIYIYIDFFFGVLQASSLPAMSHQERQEQRLEPDDMTLFQKRCIRKFGVSRFQGVWRDHRSAKQWDSGWRPKDGSNNNLLAVIHWQ